MWLYFFVNILKRLKGNRSDSFVRIASIFNIKRKFTNQVKWAGSTKIYFHCEKFSWKDSITNPAWPVDSFSFRLSFSQLSGLTVLQRMFQYGRHFEKVWTVPFKYTNYVRAWNPPPFKFQFLLSVIRFKPLCAWIVCFSCKKGIYQMCTSASFCCN